MTELETPSNPTTAPETKVVNRPPKVDVPVAAPGEKIGRFVVLEKLGQGGMGIVLKAYDPRLERDVALKCVRPGSMSTDTRGRMIREARAMAKLNHPNVVSVYDVELNEEDVVIAMEFVEGSTLRQWLASETRSWRSIVQMFIGAGRGLQAAHKSSLLHRDFKPDNVLVSTASQPKVTDFGLVQNDASQSSLAGADSVSGPMDPSNPAHLDTLKTDADMIVGTPVYMAPEQYDGGEMTRAVDQYAFCIALWQALTGRLPFGGDMRSMALEKRKGPPPWPLAETQVPRRLAAAISRGLSPEPSERWPSMESLLFELGFDPRRARRRRLAAVGAVGAVGLTWGGFELAELRVGQVCEAEGNAVHAQWTEARTARIAAAFDSSEVDFASDTWDRAERRITDYLADWSSARTQACLRGERDNSWDQETLARSRTCFDTAATHLDALGELWLEPDMGIVSSVASVVWGLPEPQSCLDEGRLLQSPLPAGEEEVALDRQARVLLAQSRAHAAVHSNDRALELLDEAEQVLEGQAMAELSVAAKVHRGRVLAGMNDTEAAIAALKDGYAAAELAELDSHALEAATILVITLAHSGRGEEGLEWAWLADKKIDRLRLPPDGGARVALENHLATAYAILGRVDEALEVFQRVAEQEKHPVWRVMTLENLAITHLQRGNTEEALGLAQETLSGYVTIYGSRHPVVARQLGLLASIHFQRGEVTKAVAMLEQSQSRTAAIFGPEDPKNLDYHEMLGKANLELRDLSAAQLHFDTALTISDKTQGPLSPYRGAVLVGLGEVARIQGRYDEGQVVEVNLVAGRLRLLEVDRVDLEQGEVALALLGRTDLALHRVTGAQRETADLRRRDVDVVGARQVVRIGRTQEAEAVLQDFDDADPCDLNILGSKLFQNGEHQLLLAHGAGIFDAVLLGEGEELSGRFGLQVL